MAEDVRLFFPTVEIKLCPKWQKSKTGFGEAHTIFPGEQRIELFFQRMKMKNVGRGVG
jgi:hypothetical protein